MYNAKADGNLVPESVVEKEFAKVQRFDQKKQEETNQYQMTQFEQEVQNESFREWVIAFVAIDVEANKEKNGRIITNDDEDVYRRVTRTLRGHLLKMGIDPKIFKIPGKNDYAFNEYTKPLLMQLTIGFGRTYEKQIRSGAWDQIDESDLIEFRNTLREALTGVFKGDEEKVRNVVNQFDKITGCPKTDNPLKVSPAILEICEYVMSFSEVETTEEQRLYFTKKMQEKYMDYWRIKIVDCAEKIWKDFTKDFPRKAPPTKECEESRKTDENTIEIII